MPITPNMALDLPDEGGDIGVWDALLNDVFDLVDAHDHTAGKGVKVPLAGGVSIGADIPWNSGGVYYAITGIKALDFQPRPAADMVAYAAALFVSDADNELYWRTQAGANVKLTAGASINAALIGGIGGDYAGVAALVDFIDASDSYRFRQQLGGGVQQYAHVSVGDLDLYEFKAHPAAGVPANRVRLSSPAGLAASYGVTFAGALPATTLPVQISAAGALIYSAAITVPTGFNMTLSGTADIKHGDRTLELSGYACFLSDASPGYTAAGGPGFITSTGAGPAIAYLPIPLKVGDRIRDVTVATYDSGASQWTNIIVTHYTKAGVLTVLGSSGVVNPGAAWQDVAIAVVDTTLAAGDQLFVEFVAGGAGLRIGTTWVVYDRP